MRKSHGPGPTGPANDSNFKHYNSESCKKQSKGNSEPCKKPIGTNIL